ncbi:MAG: hydroxymethylpyrimidine/phosphomethylpyrimidine kinase [Clostridiales bacterium]|jgi:hydroxymethylpyrimidine/phosphomethylpyrimidine kinase|nr:hydroxymethylpyrimidine/phosphomethylpyrimidine kinase [Clostridiales bacterium]
MNHLLTIAGSDCSGGAGIQADLKTFSAHGAFGMSVVTAVVAENTTRVLSIADVPLNVIADQIDAIFQDIRVDAVKVGMLSGADVMRTVAEKLRQYAPKCVVIDPVMIAKGGHALMKPEAMDALISEILPLADVLTPNIPEAEAISGITIQSDAERESAARKIHAMGARRVIIKGGHATGAAEDLLFDGKTFSRFSAPRIDTKNTHGTGCTFSSALAANLAGIDLEDTQAVHRAVALSKAYISGAIENALDLGHGHGPTNHFYNIKITEVSL